MAQIGDTVRFLNSVGGGKVVRIDGNIAYVEEDGFEIPVLLTDIVVVVPAGQEKSGPKLMFDQKAYDAGRSQNRAPEVKVVAVKGEKTPAPVEVEETTYGDNLNIVLAFEPENIKSLNTTEMNVSLVNDSNYWLFFVLMTRDESATAWKTLCADEIAPNEILDLAKFSLASISQMERIVFQANAYKKEKPFAAKYPISVSKKLDLTKFFKVHCFRAGEYVEGPAIEIPLFSER